MSARKLTLHILVEKDPESGWFTASCPALPGCITQAENEDELFENIKEAITLWLEVQDEKEMKSATRSHTSTPQVRELSINF